MLCMAMPPPQGPILAPTTPAHLPVVAAASTSVAPYGLRYRVPLIRHGMGRSVARSFGAPCLIPEQGRLIVGTGEGAILGLRLADGALLWRLQYTAPFESTPTFVTLPNQTGFVAMAARDGKLLAVDPQNGQLRWQTELAGDARAPPVQAGAQLFVTTTQNKVYALRAADGHILWSQGRAPPRGLTIEGHAGVAVTADRVYTSFSDGFAVALQRVDGTVAWERPLALRAAPFADADADPVVHGDCVLMASYNDGVYALDQGDGQTRWMYEAGGASTLLGHGDKVIVGLADGHVRALRLSDGAPLWRTHVGKGPISRVAADGDKLLLSAGDSLWAALEARTGRPVQASWLADSGLGDPQVRRGIVGVVAAAGHLLILARSP